MELRISDPRFMALLPIYVAEQRGFMTEAGFAIKWLEVNDPGKAGTLFFSGETDMIITTFPQLLAAEERVDGTLRLFFPVCETASQPGSYILVRDTTQIRTISDLRGHTLGTYSGPSQKAYALMVLDKLGFREPDDVRLIQVASSAQIQGLLGGSYDALFTVEPYGALAIESGATVIENGVRPRYISNPFWVGSGALSPTFVERYPSKVSDLRRALDKAVQYIDNNPTEARSILAKRTGIDSTVAARSGLYSWLAYPTAEEISQIQANFDLLVHDGILTKRISASETFGRMPNE